MLVMQPIPFFILIVRIFSMLVALSLYGCSQQSMHRDSNTAPLKDSSEFSKNTIIDQHLANLLSQSSMINSFSSAASTSKERSVALSKMIDRIKIDPNNPELMYGIGYLHLQNVQEKHNPNERNLAIGYFNKALELVPGNQIVLRSLYTLYYEDIVKDPSNDNIAQIKKLFFQLSDENRLTMNPPALAQYAAELTAQEKNKQSDKQALRDLLLQATQQQPYNDNAYIHLANIYAEDRYFSLALATLKWGAENINTSANLYRAIAKTYIKRAGINGCNYENISDIQQATHYYKLAIAITPDDSALHMDLSEQFLDQNLTQLSIYESIIAYTLNPSKYTLSSAAQNYSVIGKHSDANHFLQQAEAKGLEKSSSLHHEIYMNQGDWQKARQSFSSYINDSKQVSVYDVIKDDIIAHQSLQPSAIRSQQVALNNEWEEKLYNFWIFKTSDAELKAATLTRCEKTEYYFYSGYRDLQSEKIAQAKIKFAAAIDQKTYRFIERPLAAYFLKKM